MAELLDFCCGIKTSLSKVNKNSGFFFFCDFRLTRNGHF